MSKIICEFCGTAYSDTASQCPICNCVRPADNQSIMNEFEEAVAEREYHYVKGGRFSKSNVRKRNGMANADVALAENTSDGDEVSEPSNKGLVITIFVLLLAIIAVIAYVAINFFGSVLFPNSAEDTRPTILSTKPEATDVACQEIRLESTTLTIEQIGDSLALKPELVPADTTDFCTYYTANDAVAIVNSEGIVTAINSGETTITITCGSASIDCTVIVPEPAVPFTLNYTELTFTQAGEACLLYEGDIPLSEIIWATDDETVAYVEDATVIAVGSGTTTVYAGYNSQIVSCTVFCDFTEETQAPTEATYPDNGPYQLVNKYGFSNSDATIRVGESFNLVLQDKDGNTVDGVVWTVTDGDCCSVDNGKVVGVKSGRAKVVATYNGESFTFTVRVS